MITDVLKEHSTLKKILIKVNPFIDIHIYLTKIISDYMAAFVSLSLHLDSVVPNLTCLF